MRVNKIHKMANFKPLVNSDYARIIADVWRCDSFTDLILCTDADYQSPHFRAHLCFIAPLSRLLWSALQDDASIGRWCADDECLIVIQNANSSQLDCFLELVYTGQTTCTGIAQVNDLFRLTEDLGVSGCNANNVSVEPVSNGLSPLPWSSSSDSRHRPIANAASRQRRRRFKSGNMLNAETKEGSPLGVSEYSFSNANNIALTREMDCDDSSFDTGGLFCQTVIKDDVADSNNKPITNTMTVEFNDPFQLPLNENRSKRKVRNTKKGRNGARKRSKKRQPAKRPSCPLCGMIFETQSALEKHILGHGNIPLPIKCTFDGCAKSFMSSADLKRHVRMRHDATGTRMCRVCSLQVASVEELRKHEQLLHDDNETNTHPEEKHSPDGDSSDHKSHFKRSHKFPATACETCGQVFRLRGRYKAHVLQHQGVLPGFACPVSGCGKEFYSDRSLRWHLSHKHRSSDDEHSLVCRLCDQSFDDKREHEKHVNVFHRRSTHLCQVCCSQFQSPITLDRHMLKAHGGEKSFACTLCPKTFYLSQDLYMHQRRHTENESQPQVECPVCRNLYRDKYTLKAHMITHSDLRPWVCEICSKGFHTKGQLGVHVLFHKGIRPNSCDHCSKSFTSKNDLKRHLWLHQGLKQFACQCGMRFTLKGSLTKHIPHCKKNNGGLPLLSDHRHFLHASQNHIDENSL